MTNNHKKSFENVSNFLKFLMIGTNSWDKEVYSDLNELEIFFKNIKPYKPTYCTLEHEFVCHCLTEVYSEYNYCPECGQKLDWWEENG